MGILPKAASFVGVSTAETAVALTGKMPCHARFPETEMHPNVNVNTYHPRLASQFVQSTHQPLTPALMAIAGTTLHVAVSPPEPVP